MKISSAQKQEERDFDLLVKDLMNEYGNIFFSNINGECFIYKALTRKEYREIVENDNLMNIEKEDEVCMATILWPENLDYDEVPAGVISKLYKEVIQNSFLDGAESILQLINIYREELEQLDTQMGCVISEAFPNIDIDEIENWDMIKFCKMFTKAEWKLKNLRNIDNMMDIAEYLESVVSPEDNNNQAEDNKAEVNEGNISNDEELVRIGSNTMTKAEYDQYLKFQDKFKEIDWGADAMYTGYDTQTASTVPVALR